MIDNGNLKKSFAEFSSYELTKLFYNSIIYATHILLLQKSQSLQTKHYTVQHTGQDQYLPHNKNWESLELNTVKQWNSMDFN